MGTMWVHLNVKATSEAQICAREVSLLVPQC